VTTILLARHGETDWNLHRRVQGHSDTPLNDTGRDQARALADALDAEELDAVYSSDLVRAHETARIVAEHKGLAVTAMPELREKHFGTWEGLTDEEILSRFPEAALGHWGDGETTEEMARRVQEVLDRIARAHPEGRVLVITHGGPVRAALAASGVERGGPIGNCAVHELRFRDGTFSVD